MHSTDQQGTDPQSCGTKESCQKRSLHQDALHPGDHRWLQPAAPLSCFAPACPYLWHAAVAAAADAADEAADAAAGAAGLPACAAAGAAGAAACAEHVAGGGGWSAPLQWAVWDSLAAACCPAAYCSAAPLAVDCLTSQGS